MELLVSLVLIAFLAIAIKAHRSLSRELEYIEARRRLVRRFTAEYQEALAELRRGREEREGTAKP